jgi:hypothetical protein
LVNLTKKRSEDFLLKENLLKTIAAPICASHFLFVLRSWKVSWRF